MSSNSVENLPSQEVCELFDGWCKTRIKFVKYNYIWTVNNFSLRPEGTGQWRQSPLFPDDPENKVKWRLKMYPAGYDKGSQEYVSLFLGVVSCDDNGIKANCKLNVLNLNGSVCVPNGGSNLFTKGTEWGFKKFILQREIQSDTLTISCEIIAGVETVDISHQSITSSTVPQCDLSADYRILFESQELCDIIIVTDEKEFKAHKVILGARSPVFKAMFLNQMKESELNQVEILDVDHTVLNEMLRFIYTGEVQNLKSIASDLLSAADKYALESLKVMCEEELCKTVSVKNAAKVLILSDLHNTSKLKLQTKKYITTYAQEVTETPGWKSMIQSYPHLVTEVFCDLATHCNSVPDLRKE